jgi:hypothetical protein
MHFHECSRLALILFRRQLIDLNDCNVNIDEVKHSCIQKTCKRLQNKSKQQSKCEAAAEFVAKCLENKPPNVDFYNWRIELSCREFKKKLYFKI